MQNDVEEKLGKWLTEAERRYRADLRIQEITRALRALSSAYVERRERGTGRRVQGALDTAGKRAAFALYYAPLHFIAVTEALRALRATDSAPSSIIDPDVWRETIKEVRENAVAYDLEECDVGARCVAAPLRDSHGYAVAAISISTLVRQTDQMDFERMTTEIQRLAKEISAFG